MALQDIGDNIEKAAEGVDKAASSAKNNTWGWAYLITVAVFGIGIWFLIGQIKDQKRDCSDYRHSADSIIEAKNNQLIILSRSNILINDKAQKVDSLQNVKQ